MPRHSGQGIFSPQQLLLAVVLVHILIFPSLLLIIWQYFTSTHQLPCTFIIWQQLSISNTTQLWKILLPSLSVICININYHSKYLGCNFIWSREIEWKTLFPKRYMAYHFMHWCQLSEWMHIVNLLLYSQEMGSNIYLS